MLVYYRENGGTETNLMDKVIITSDLGHESSRLEIIEIIIQTAVMVTPAAIEILESQ